MRGNKIGMRHYGQHTCTAFYFKLIHATDNYMELLI